MKHENESNDEIAIANQVVTNRRSIEDVLGELEAERSIRNLIHRYCDSADRRDWERFKSVFHPDSTHRHGNVFQGRSLDFAAVGEALLAAIEESHHQIGNIVTKISGMHAVSQCYFTAHHLIRADAPTDVLPGHCPGVMEDWWVGGRYFDRYEHRDGRWGIVHRTAVHDWERWEPADTRGFERVMSLIPAPID